MRRKLIIAAAVAITIITGLVLLFVRSQGKPESVPTVAPSAVSTFDTDPHQESETVHQVERERNPILRELPENNRFWSLSFNGSVGNKYKLRAVVYYTAGQDPDERISQQRQYILAYLDRIGQPRDTYVISYESKRINSEGY